MELERQKTAKKDFIVDTGAMRMTAEDGRSELEVGTPATGIVPYGINDIAHRQIGQFLKIPAAYYDRMRSTYPDLLVENVNGWLSRTPGTSRMIRTMDGVARAFLSERYRRIDNLDIANITLPIIGEMPDAYFESCQLTDSRMYIKVVDPRTTAEIRKGDVVQAGVVITNSEVGMGSVNVSPLVYRLVCSNGMIAQDNAVRKYHVGRTNTADDDLGIYRDETIQADDRAFLMKLEDSVRAAVSQAHFERLVGKMREATDAKLNAATVPQVVELTAKEYGFTEDEGKGILGHLISGGDLSLYGLANAVTRHAQDVESYDRSTDLEAAGYRIITMAPAFWRQLSTL